MSAPTMHVGFVVYGGLDGVSGGDGTRDRPYRRRSRRCKRVHHPQRERLSRRTG
ncbi:hypothetical protein [Halovenus sp. HT40]|uniref:hypothetical protein n=1 Tax=Halovenus sp. HT40 TaxID=3126691 RepID=UPI00300F4404